MKEQSIITNIVWDGIPIEIKYSPEYSTLLSAEDLVSHVEVKAKEQLPITKTGYRSNFFFQKRATFTKSVDNMVKEWLEEKAKSKEWQAYRKNRQQLKLF